MYINTDLRYGALMHAETNDRAPYIRLYIDWPYILGVAILTTCLGHTLFVQNLKNYTASTISLLVSIVPVYGIIWGVIFLNEIPGFNVVLGGAIILAAFVIESRRNG